jgi:hypothetical protein
MYIPIGYTRRSYRALYGLHQQSQPSRAHARSEGLAVVADNMREFVHARIAGRKSGLSPTSA